MRLSGEKKKPAPQVEAVKPANESDGMTICIIKQKKGKSNGRDFGENE